MMMLTKSQTTKSECLIIALISWALCTYHAWTSGIDINFDLKNYHLYDVYALFHDRVSIDIAPATMHTWFNPLSQIPSYFITRYVDGRVGVVIYSFISSLNLLVIYLLTREIINEKIDLFNARFIAIMAMLCAFFSPLFLSVIGTTFNDGLSAFFVLLALYIAIKYNFSLKSLIFAALFVGFVVSIKLTNIIYAPAFVLSLLTVKSVRNIKTIITICFYMFIGYVPLGATWNIYLYIKYGNPVFPIMNNIFKSPYFAYESMADRRFIPQSIRQALEIFPKEALDIRVTSENSFRDVRFLFLGILLICLWPVFIFSRNTNEDRIFKETPVKVLWIFVLISMISWLKIYGIERYIVLIEQLAPILIFTFIDRIDCKKIGKIIGILTASLFIISVVKPVDWDHKPLRSHSWLKTTYPEQLKNKDVTYIILEDYPIAYMVLDAPENSVFIRIYGNLPNMRQTLLGKKAQEIIDNSKGEIRTLATVKEAPQFADLLQSYHLKLDTTDCLEVKSGIETVFSCALSKTH